MNDQVLAVVEKQVAEEYAIETNDTQALLKHCGIEEEDLSKNGQLYLHVLSEIAELLQLKDVQTSSFLMAINDLEESLDEAEQEATHLQGELEKSRKRHEEMKLEYSDLENVARQLKDTVEERERHENSRTMEQRTEEFTERQRTCAAEIEKLNHVLVDLNFDEVRHQVEHHHIAALEQECVAIETENARLQDQLSQYHNLPLNKELVAATLYDAKAELQRLEEHFHREIKKML